MATNFLVKQGKVMGGVRLVTDADVAHQTDLTNIRETGTTSSQAISAGKYFYLNNVLVRAKVDIASGATFTLNTNYEVVTAGALNELNDKFNYSETERVVGKWIDGRTLYEKTVDCGALPSTAGNKAVAHNISNINKIISITGVAMRDNGLTITLPNTAVDALSSQIVLYADKTNINIYVASNQSVNTNSYVTLRYTKTS